MGARLAGYILIIIGVVGIAAVLFMTSEKSRTALVFSPDLVLSSTWSAYKANYLEVGTSRTLDPQQGNITTSEGESYTMLRAVWEDDKQTFDASWKWTKDNLQHTKGDHLFSWRFGQKPDGTYGVLTDLGGDTSASDADTDIALALLFAYARWQDHQYIGDARVIMSGIWDSDVVTINGTPYLSADDKEKAAPDVAVINPSYLNPAAYHIFAKFDDSHPWGALADSSYDVLGQAITLSLGTGSSAGLPPNWVKIDKKTGALSATGNAATTTDFGYDALRVPWRLTLDRLWFKDPRAETTLAKLSFLGTEWKDKKKLAATYAHDGTVTDPQEIPAMYGGTIGYFLAEDPAAAKEIYETKLGYLYDPATSKWKETLSYYDDNWAWFGIAAYAGLLPDLTAGLPPSAFQQ